MQPQNNKTPPEDAHNLVDITIYESQCWLLLGFLFGWWSAIIKVGRSLCNFLRFMRHREAKGVVAKLESVVERPFFSFWCDTVSVQTDGRKHRFLPLVNPFLSDVFAFNQNLGEFNQTLDYSSEAQIGVSLAAWQFRHLRGCCKTLQPFLTRIVIHGGRDDQGLGQNCFFNFEIPPSPRPKHISKSKAGIVLVLKIFYYRRIYLSQVWIV